MSVSEVFRAVPSSLDTISPQARTLIIVNQTAGAARKVARLRQAILDRLKDLPGGVSHFQTAEVGDAREAAQLAVQYGYARIFVAGGDGTLNDVIQVLAGTEVALGIIPTGTTNVLAHELGLPGDGEAIAALLEAGHTRRIDLGRANGRYFSMMAGLGFDGELTFNLRPEVKRRFGNFAYLEAGVKTAFRHKPCRMRIDIDADLPSGRRIRRNATWVVFSNTRFYGGKVFKVNERADIADGLFDICLSRAPNTRGIAKHFYAVATGRHRAMHDFEFFQARRLTIRTSRPYPYQLDGDAAGMTPLELELVPGALKVIVAAPLG